MYFKIQCIDPVAGNEPVSYVFDNETNEVFDSQGEEIDFTLDERFAHIKPFTSMKEAPVYGPSAPITKKAKLLNKLRIQLGMACNYNCSYCLQAAFRSPLDRVPNAQSIDAFFEKIQSAGIHLAPNGCVELWGGEPLVYWKTLRILIPRLRQEYGDDVVIKMITNGSLLTRELIDFFNAHRVVIGISHDGPGFSLRDAEDPLFDPETKDAWKYLFKTSSEIGIPMSFVCVLSPQNCNLDEVREFFDRNFSPNVAVFFEGVVSYSGAQQKGCAFDQESARKLDSSIFKAIVTQPGKWPTLDEEARILIRRFIHRAHVKAIPGRCDEMRKNTLTVNLNGEIGSCHNRPVNFWKIGDLSTFPTISNGNMMHWSLRPACSKCFLLSSCKGGCPHLSNEELRQCCSNEYVYHAAIFGAVWYLLTGKIFVQSLPM